jgi:hypothetical protein
MIRAARILLIALALALAFPALALENLGLVVGLDRTELQGDEPPNFRYKADSGYLVGAVVEFSLGRDVLLSLQPGYLHSRTDIAYKDKRAGVVRDSLKLDVDWFVLPVVARIKSSSGALFATGGLDFAWAMGGGISDGATETAADTFIREVNLSAIVGAGLEFRAGRNRITAELRYRQGLVNSARNDEGTTLSALPTRFRFAGFQLQAGYLIPLGGR